MVQQHPDKMKFKTAEQHFLCQILIRISELHVKKRLILNHIHADDNSQGFQQYLEKELVQVQTRLDSLLRVFKQHEYRFVTHQTGL